MVNFNPLTGSPFGGQPFMPCLCCPCCLGDSFFSAKSGITVTHYDAIVASVQSWAIPFVKSLNPCFHPLYEMTDQMGCCCVPTDPNRPSAQSVPVVLFARRTVKSTEAYKPVFQAYAEDAMKGPGVRACFSFVERDIPNTVVQLLWLDTAADLPVPPSDLISCYNGSPATDFVQVWGKWDEALKAKLQTDTKCKFNFNNGTRGFIKSPSAATAPGFATGSPPMIWISQRKIVPGKMEQCGRHFQYGTDMMYDTAPAALAIAEFTDENVDYNTAPAAWSLRVFNDYNMGFKAHFPVPSCIMCRMAWNVMPTWEPGLFAVGYNFSTKARRCMTPPLPQS